MRLSSLPSVVTNSILAEQVEIRENCEEDYRVSSENQRTGAPMNLERRK